MKLGVIGASYVGLTTAVCLASMKHEISIFDIDNEKIKCVSEKKKCRFLRPGLEELLEVNVSKKNLQVKLDDLKYISTKYRRMFYLCRNTNNK